MICCFEKKGKITELLDILKIQMKIFLVFFDTFWSFLNHRRVNDLFSKQIRHIDFGKLLGHFSRQNVQPWSYHFCQWHQEIGFTIFKTSRFCGVGQTGEVDWIVP